MRNHNVVFVCMDSMYIKENLQVYKYPTYKETITLCPLSTFLVIYQRGLMCYTQIIIYNVGTNEQDLKRVVLDTKVFSIDGRVE